MRAALGLADKVVVEGVNVAQRHRKPTKAMEQGGIIQMEMPIHVSNVAHVDPKDNKPTPIPTMEAMFPDAKNFQHGRGRIWCLECHHATQRNKLAD